MTEPLIPQHGGYRRLKSFQVAQLIYDLTVKFCDSYVDARSRTHDQMVQAARSGVQNIAEGSQVSGTSRKMELKLTNVARASLEELRLDYEDFLRQHGHERWPPEHPALQRFKARRCATVAEVGEWLRDEKARRQGADEHGRTRTDTDQNNPEPPPSVLVRGGPCAPEPTSVFVANAALSLLNLACHLLDRQMAAQARAFEEGGGFTERLHRTRTARRNEL